MDNLEDVITDSVNDAVSDSELDTGDSHSEAAEDNTSAETPSASDSTPEDAAANTQADSSAVASPAAGAAETSDEPQDEFAKLAGVPQVGFGGRENRIPYSRVKKITEKSVSDVAEVALGRKLNQGEKPIDAIKAHVAQIPELQTKVSEYETRLGTVGQFESVMANEPERFLGMLARIPAYREFFEFVQQASDFMDQQAAQPGAGQPPAEYAAVDPASAMPEPDEELSDGSKVYSMDGLKKLLAWNASQTEQRVEQRVTKQFEERYKTVEPAVKDWQEQRRIQAALPVVRKQIEEAKTWPLFSESEEEIIGILKTNPQISLEGAYRQIVFPKLVAERNKVRQDVIREAQAAPTSTSVPTRAASKPGTQTGSGPRKLEDIIKEQVERLK